MAMFSVSCAPPAAPHAASAAPPRHPVCLSRLAPTSKCKLCALLSLALMAERERERERAREMERCKREGDPCSAAFLSAFHMLRSLFVVVFRFVAPPVWLLLMSGADWEGGVAPVLKLARFRHSLSCGYEAFFSLSAYLFYNESELFARAPPF